MSSIRQLKRKLAKNKDMRLPPVPNYGPKIELQKNEEHAQENQNVPNLKLNNYVAPSKADNA